MRAVPAFITGTSTEYLGKRPLRRLVRERPVVALLGPKGVGKTSVARRIAGGGPSVVVLDPPALDDAILRRTRSGAWDERLLEASGLVIDGPRFLPSRPTALELVCDLVRTRASNGGATVLCEGNGDGSVRTLLGAVPRGRMVTVGLRFPESRGARMRYARRLCDELGLPRALARGTDALDPWTYEAVHDVLTGQAEETA